jgi:hypothetical protein
VWSTNTGSGDKWEDQENSKGNNNGRSSLQYEVFSSYQEWVAASGLTATPIVGLNYGDLPAPFELSCNTTTAVTNGTTITVGENSVTILETCPAGSRFMWNSQTGAITAIFNNKRRAVKFSGNSLITIPVTTDNEAIQFKVNGTLINSNVNWNIKYHYWYY